MMWLTSQLRVLAILPPKRVKHMVFQAFDWEGPGQDRFQAGGPILSLGGRVGGIQVVKEGLR